jgi:y4mF family transcriptional regulator
MEGLVRISNSRDLGLYLRERRRDMGMTQAAVATAAGVSLRWLSSLESGKATAEIGLVFKVIHALRLAVDLAPATLPPDAIDLDELIRSHGRPT